MSKGQSVAKATEEVLKKLVTVGTIAGAFLALINILKKGR
jgi:hypothetical protein